MCTRKPNVIITGSPATGKTTISLKVAKKLNLKYVNISKFAIKRKLIIERDDGRDCDVIDERRVWKRLKKKLLEGGYLLEYHSCGFLKRDLFDAVFVLRTGTSELHRRLTKRGYKDSKITENIECEIFQVSLEEAIDAFGPTLVTELENNDKSQRLKNIKTIIRKIRNILGKTKSTTI